MAERRSHRELKELLAILGDEELDADETQRLDKILRGDPEARRLYHDYVDVHVLLKWMHTPPPVLAETSLAAEEEREAKVENVQQPSQLWRSRLQSARQFFTRPTPLSVTVAALFIGLLITALALTTAPIYQRWAGGGDEDKNIAPLVVAELTGFHEPVWASGQVGTHHGAHLVVGHRLELKEGLAEVTFQGGARVLLEGPGELIFNSAAGGTLESGKLTAHVPEQARGFAIDTKHASIVDLGTEFGVSVGMASGTTVRVFEGRVVVAQDQSNRQHTLLAGDALSISEDGTAWAAGEDLDAAAGRFVRVLPESQYKRLVAGAKPVAWWRLEDAGATVARDASGNGRHGTYAGTVRSVASVPGLGRAADLNAASFVDVPAFPDMSAATGLTVEAWIRYPLDIPGTWERIVEKDYTSGFVMTVNPSSAPRHKLTAGHVMFGINKTFAESSIPVNDGRWHHVAGVWDGRTLVVYADGQPGSPVDFTGAIGSSTQPLRIGANSNNASQERIRGALDEIAIYGRALSAEEIRDHYLAAGQSVTAPPKSIDDS